MPSLGEFASALALILSCGTEATAFSPTAATVAGQRSTKMSTSLEGELFIYSSTKRLAAFKSGGGRSDRRRRRGHVVFVPGLTNGLLALSYIPALAKAMDRLGLSLVQPILSSSYKGYGTSCLRQDVEELDALLAHLLADADKTNQPSDDWLSSPAAETHSRCGNGSNGSQNHNIILIGHSTGCQDAVFYMRHGRPDLRARVRGVVLQAPVSDREWRESLPETAGFIEEARDRLAAGGEPGGQELMPAAAETDAPITISRFLSLSTKDGDDDMFSSDLSAEERFSRLGHMASVPTAAFLSGNDEFVPTHLSRAASGGGNDPRSSVEILAHNLSTVLLPQGAWTPASERPQSADGSGGIGAGSAVHVIEQGNHALTDEKDATEFAEKVEDFISNLLKDA